MESGRLRSGCTLYQIKMLRRECRFGWIGCAWAILATLDPWERDYPNCESTLVLDTEFISR
jgi:hypothetical protein